MNQKGARSRSKQGGKGFSVISKSFSNGRFLVCGHTVFARQSGQVSKSRTPCSHGFMPRT